MSEQVVESEDLDIETEESLDEESVGLRDELSAFLFVSTKPVPVQKLAEWSKVSEEEVEEAVERIQHDLTESSLGFELLKVGDSYQFRTRPRLAKSLRKMITPKMKRLSKAAAETLAVVAYKQPVSKAEIEAIRGVDALPTLKTLLDAKLIRIVGREDAAGSPALYGTSDFFLEKFGLKDLSELPTIREAKELSEELAETLAESESVEENIAESENDSSDESIETNEEHVIS